MTPQEIETLANEALDAAAAVIQNRLGIKTGDLAGIVFSDGAAINELQRYIEAELAAARS